MPPTYATLAPEADDHLYTYTGVLQVAPGERLQVVAWAFDDPASHLVADYDRLWGTLIRTPAGDSVYLLMDEDKWLVMEES